MVLREAQQLPVGMLEQILEYRNYARMWRVNDTAVPGQVLPQTPLMQLVQTIELELAAEEIAHRE